jgi:hypothetical protein
LLKSLERREQAIQMKIGVAVTSAVTALLGGLYGAFAGDVVGFLIGLPSLIFTIYEAPSVARSVFGLDEIRQRQAEMIKEIERLEQRERCR